MKATGFNIAWKPEAYLNKSGPAEIELFRDLLEHIAIACRRILGVSIAGVVQVRSDNRFPESFIHLQHVAVFHEDSGRTVIFHARFVKAFTAIERLGNIVFTNQHECVPHPMSAVAGFVKPIHLSFFAKVIHLRMNIFTTVTSKGLLDHAVHAGISAAIPTYFE